MKHEAPAWLGELQLRFGEVIRTPLDRTSGTLTATPSAYDARVLRDTRDATNATGAERLAVYNRQYWFRLFDLLQSAFPLVSKLLGYWAFNDYASRFLSATPPRGWDLDLAADGFPTFFESSLASDDERRRDALVESARIDAAFRDVLRAPKFAPFRPTAATAARLLDVRLTPSPAVRFVEESFPLLDLRRKLLVDAGESGEPRDGRVEIPPPLPTRRAYAIARRDDGILQLSLEPREAELLALLREHTVRDALAHLEQSCGESERASLPRRAQSWLANSVARDFWSDVTIR